MKDASKILYKIGNIFNIIGIVFAVLAAIIFFAGYGIVDAKMAQEMGKTIKEAQAIYLTLGIVMIICVVVWCIVYFFAKKAIKALNDNSNSTSPHVIMIVIGIIGSSIFYLLGGVFGVIAETQK